jgi:YVTN family beta-propeller protein
MCYVDIGSANSKKLRGRKPMKVHSMPLFLAAAAAMAFAGSAQAAGMKQVGSIELPGGEPITDIGVITIDQATGLGYLPDKANKSVVIFDTKTDAFVSRIPGFIGLMKSSNLSGPNGTAVVNDGAELWVSDGDSTIKVIDLKTSKVTETISTGGKLRANGMAYGDRMVIVANSNDETPYLSLISTADRKILAKILLPDTGENIERSAYHAPSGMFYTAVPVSKSNPDKGQMVQVDAKAGKLIKLHQLDCHPHSLAVVSDSTILLGCSSQHGPNSKPGGDMAIFDIPSGKFEYSAGNGGNGGSTVNTKNGQYYHTTTQGELIIVDGKTKQLVQKIKTSGGARTASVSQATNKLYVASVANKDGSGKASILIFAPVE